MSTIGLDVGTSRVKAVRFDADWQAADAESESSVISRGADGRSEQDMAQVWESVRRVLAAVTQRSPDPISLVAVTGQGDGCWLVDDAGRPVGPALLWNDNRAAEVVSRWQGEGRLEEAFRRTGCMGSAGIANAQLAWLERHQPDVVARASTLLSCSAWIYLQLTGRRVLEQSEAANPFFDARSGEYDRSLFALYEIEGLARLMPPVVRSADRIAPLCRARANEFGLPTDTPVAIAPLRRTGDRDRHRGHPARAGFRRTRHHVVRRNRGRRPATGQAGQRVHPARR